MHPSFSFSPSAARLSLCRNKVCYICVCLCLCSLSVVSREIVSHRCLGGGGDGLEGTLSFLLLLLLLTIPKPLDAKLRQQPLVYCQSSSSTLYLFFFFFLSLLLIAFLVCAGRDISNCFVSHTAIVYCNSVLNTKKR